MMSNVNTLRFFHLICIISIICLRIPAYGQKNLSLSDAIDIALENNLSIDIAERHISLTEKNTGLGAAGMLPSLTLNGNVDYALSSVSQVYLDGRENSIKGGKNWVLGADLRLDWTLFDGMAMYARKDALEHENIMAQEELKIASEDLMLRVSKAYENLVLTTKEINILNHNIAYLKDLYELNQQKLSLGSATRIDVLQAKTDLNELQNQRALLEFRYATEEAALNLELRAPVSTHYSVDSNFVIVEDRTYEEWVKESAENNSQKIVAEQSLEMTKYDKRIAKAGRFPSIRAVVGADYSYLNSSTGFLVSNNAYGPYVGVSATYNLFDGNRVNRAIAQAEIRHDIASMKLDKVSREVDNAIYIAYRQLQYRKKQVVIERENLTLVEENLALAGNLYKSGKITQYEWRQIFIQKLAIEKRIVEAEHQYVLAYLTLMHLSGNSWL